MTRVAIPELFTLRGRTTTVGDSSVVELRWMIHPSGGLPYTPFRVWVRDPTTVKTDRVGTTTDGLPDGTTAITWDNRGAAVVTLTTSVSSGALTVRGMSGPDGTGQVVDEGVAAIGTPTVTLAGSVIRSVVTLGSGTAAVASVVWMDALVNDPGWKLWEIVGLPADKVSFDGTGYDTGEQGLVSAPTDPVSAAILRLKQWQPTSGWEPITDLGKAAPPWTAPDPTAWVEELRKNVLPGVAKMLGGTSWPLEHEGFRVPTPIDVPVSVHGDALDPAGESTADLGPLGQLLLGATSDAFGALGLGFGTTVPTGKAATLASARAANPAPVGIGLVMVTVEHEIRTPGDDVNLVKVELADVFLQPVVAGPASVTGLTADTLAIDRPQKRDEPWLFADDLSWDRPEPRLPDDPHVVSYAVVRYADSGDQLLLDVRQAGGPRPWVAATDPELPPQSAISFVDRGLGEPRPGESGDVSYAVAGQDAFGRWSKWVSVPYAVATVAPAVPSVVRVTPEVADGGEVRGADVVVDVAWDWADRSPKTIELVVVTHAAGTVAGSSSTREVGGPAVPDVVLSFGLDPDVPPAGAELLPAEPGAPPEQRVVRVRVPGFRFDFGAHPRIEVTARARAEEQFRPGVWSGHGPDRAAVADSPIPPGPVFVPAGMTWASVPDPAGIARVRLAFTPAPGATSTVVYAADEAAVRREAGLPAPDVSIGPEQRLPDLRVLDPAAVRRAFKRVDRVTGGELDLDLPRGSRLVHLFALVPVSASGVEGSHPSDGNGWLAVAVPRVVTLPPPTLRLRPLPGGARVVVEVQADSPPARLSLHRGPTDPRQALSVDRMGLPIAELGPADAVASGDRFVYTVDDLGLSPWVDWVYRAVVWPAPADGQVAARSVSAAVVGVVPAAGPPPAPTLAVSERQGDWHLVKIGNVPRAVCRDGGHSLTVAVRVGAASELRRTDTAAVATVVGAPAPADTPPIFAAVDAFAAWIEAGDAPFQVVARVADPLGRSATTSLESP
ncbi:MAG: hypothetical protein ABMA64_25620 [Myxococcota bacterium]